MMTCDALEIKSKKLQGTMEKKELKKNLLPTAQHFLSNPHTEPLSPTLDVKYTLLMHKGSLWGLCMNVSVLIERYK